jgi:Carboxypeptidase regulatory-like domain/TonB dependent receptor-like, beta-barrel
MLNSVNLSSVRLVATLQLLALLVVGLSLVNPVFAQVVGATLTGSVEDSSGGPIPDAQITITNTQTGVKWTVSTNSAGLFAATNLTPGNYEVSASAHGFSKAVQSGVNLTVGSQQSLKFSMRVGSLSTTVRVSGQAPLIQLESSTLGGEVNQSTVRELPLNGRDWTQLAVLEPGVISDASIQPNATGSNGIGGFARGLRGYGAQLSITGGRPQQNNYRIDGISVNDYANGGPGSVLGATLGVDAIQEFSVLTSNYTAEYGRTSGGVINAVTKSGSNSFHGDVYEFLRNNALDARNYFNTTGGEHFEWNQFGASAGGPIRKNRTFVFGDYEGFRQTKSVPSVNSVPSPNARSGIIQNTSGPPTTVTVDPSVEPFLALWPLPNGPLIGNGNVGRYTFLGSQVTSENFVDVRVDNTFSTRDSLSGSFQLDKAVFTGPDSLGDVLSGSATNRYFAQLEETHIVNSQFTNSLRGGFNRTQPLIAFGKSAINPAAGDPALGAVPGRYAPAISVPGITSFSGGVNSPTHTQVAYNSYQLYDDAFLIKGIHSFKFGFAFERMQDNVLSFSTWGGKFAFGSLTNFLTNKPTSFTSAIPSTFVEAGYRQSRIAAYAQDDVHLRTNLTLNLGLRYEMTTVPTGVGGRIASLRTPTSPAPEVGGPLFSNPTLRNFEPRIGFAWDPFGTGKTSVRGAFGVFDVLPLPYLYYTIASSAAPFNLQGSAPQPLAPGSFPTGAFASLQASSKLRDPYIQSNPARNYVMEWNLNIQRQITPTLSASVGYVGSRGVHMVFHSDDINGVQPTLTSAGYLWPMPGSGTPLNPSISREDNLSWTSNSFYDALELHLEKRMSHGVQIEGSYTWGRCIDEGSATTFGDQFVSAIPGLPFFDRRLRRGPCDYNVTQSLVVNYIWNVPSPQSVHGLARLAAKGWQLVGIYKVNTGTPFTPIFGGDPLGQGNTAPYDVPNRVSGCALTNPGNPINYINTSCYTLPLATPAIAANCVAFSAAPGTCQNLLGNAGRNNAIGPGFQDFDFSLFKNNYIKESFNVQFRAEFFNIFNHPNFASPIDNSILFDQSGAPIPGAGLIDATTNDSREIQLALKLIW